MIVRIFLGNLLSRPLLQPFWHLLLKVSHACMNIGGGYCVSGSGERFALKKLSRFLHTNGPMIIFDVGANAGDYAIMAKQVFSSARIYCFEPGVESFQCLSNIFAADPLVTCEKIALGKENGTSSLFFEHPGDLTATLRCNTFVRKQSAKQQEVALMTLDEFCSSRGIKKIDFLKIDTEGAEFDALVGAKTMLESQCITAIQFEFGETYIGSGLYFRSFWEMLSPKYRIFRILKRGLFEIEEYTFDCEVMKITNYIALLRSHLDSS